MAPDASISLREYLYYSYIIHNEFIHYSQWWLYGRGRKVLPLSWNVKGLYISHSFEPRFQRPERKMCHNLRCGFRSIPLVDQFATVAGYSILLWGFRPVRFYSIRQFRSCSTLLWSSTRRRSPGREGTTGELKLRLKRVCIYTPN